MQNVSSEDYIDSKTGKFKPGNPGGGRPKGVPSERTKRWEELGEYLVTRGAERTMNMLDSLSDEEFIKHYKDLLEYFKPKQSRIEAKVESTHTTITIEAPTPKRSLGEGHQIISIPEKIEEAEVIPGESCSKSDT
jgi:hypothetical protein